MKLDNLNGLNILQPTRLPHSDAAPTSGGGRFTLHSGSDHVNVSARAEEASRFIAGVGDLGDIRQERVDSIRQAVQSNQYRVSSSRIADAIMRWEKAA